MGNVNWTKGGIAMKELKQYKNQLTKQQYKTLKGQILAGDKIGAMKGLNKILNRSMK